MEGHTLIEARNLQVTVGAKSLLEGVSVKLNVGEVVAIVGPNGAGKSTLRRALSGDLKPARGEVFMSGRPIEDWPVIERARVRAVLPQDSTLSFPFTVFEVVLMGRTPHVKGTESERDYEIAREALELVEARHLEQRLYPTLSGGERQRVQLARVLAQIWESPANEVAGKAEIKARYLLMDEPTSSLDLAHQHGSLEIARRLAGEGVGVMVILHDLNLAAQYADRIVMMKDGAITYSGPPACVLTSGAIYETFSIEVAVTSHPYLKCPLVVYHGTGRRAECLSDAKPVYETSEREALRGAIDR